ncbi:MAG: U32 family peptidase [Clostridia bacterium]|nr:U32 family peptidase [Clostridia bacterium]
MDKKIELLSPAGDWDALIAAVESGADAVYLGMKTLNARRGAGNFDDELLVRAADYLHERGKKMYVTVNTVVKESEMGLLDEIARSLSKAGADAAIMQDFGVAAQLGHMLPSLSLHASTQMAAHNRQAVEFLKEKGFERAVLAREMTFSEIASCAETGVELEVFCHGALCVACSGQCLFSSLVGGRSGNRGMCAQPCRLKYTLTGAKTPANGYLLSPKDLMTVECIDQLRNAGATSLKIEGRLKRPEYVHIVTSIYRRALDGDEITQNDIENLKQIFNRGGFTTGYGPGIIDGKLISHKRPSHWGVKVGESMDGKRIKMLKSVLNADALTIRPENGEDVPLKLNAEAGITVKNPIGVKGDVMRLVSDQQMTEAAQYLKDMHPMVPLSMSVKIKVGESARCEVSDGVHTASETGWMVESAAKAGADFEKIRQQASKMGNTPYYVKEFSGDIDPNAFVPASGINALRRDAVEAIKNMRLKTFRGAGEKISGIMNVKIPSANGNTRMVVQSHDAQTLIRLKNAGADEIAFCPKDVRIHALDESTKDLYDFFVVLPPVMGERTLDAVHKWANENESRIKGVYLTNVGQLGFHWPGEIRYDFPLNLANGSAIAFLNAKDNVITPSVELTAKEIEEMGGKRELIVYGNLPLMHLRHCPLNASLNGGKHADCRRCDRVSAGERLEDCAFKDRMNVSFALKRLATDEGCVIDVINSVPLFILKHAKKLPSADGWRLIFTDESAEEAEAIFKMHASFMDNGTQESEIKTFTTGHYFRPVE